METIHIPYNSSKEREISEGKKRMLLIIRIGNTYKPELSQTIIGLTIQTLYILPSSMFQ